MNSSFFKKAIWLLFYTLVFIFLIYNSFNYLDADFGWHLKVGEQIAREHAIPSFDYYNHTLTGKTWVDHEWLSNYLSYKIFHNLGYLSLTVFFALIIIFSLFLINLLIKKYYLPKYQEKTLNIKQTILIMFFQMLGVMAMAPHLGVRMQEVTLLYLVILLIVLINFNTKKNYRILFFLIPLFYIWASTHAGFLIGLCILFFFVGIKLCQNLLVKIKYFNNFEFSSPLDNKNIFIVFVFGVFSIIATLCTPYGLKLYSFLFDYSNTFYMKIIAEWLPAYCLPIQYKQLLYSAILTTAILLFVITTYFAWRKNEKSKIDLWLLAISLLFLILSFKSKRHFPLFFVVSFPLIIQLADTYLTYPPNFFSYFKKSNIIKFYLICGFILACANTLIHTDFVKNPFDQNHYCDIFPCGAVNFLENHPEYNNYKIFNSYDWGGYLAWAYPGRKTFIDGRLPQYKYAGHTLLEEYLDFFKDNKTGEKLNQYGINLIIYRKPVAANIGWFEKHILAAKDKEDDKNYFKEYLDNHKEWEIVFEDGNGLIYVKK